MAGPLERRVLARPKKDRAAECARILAEVASGVTAWEERRGSVTYRLSLPGGAIADGPQLVVSKIECVPAPPVPLDPPYVFVNPPLKVRDGTMRDEKARLTGAPVSVANFREDATAALRQMIADTVLRDQAQ
jgi:hypothetical protein